jgi:DNA (cytosine-5)-methyltransferase 1
VAWVTWDAQYFGVPQRRKRIFLVADFAGYSPIQILFDQDRLLGNTAESEGTWEATAENAGNSPDTAGRDK